MNVITKQANTLRAMAQRYIARYATLVKFGIVGASGVIVNNGMLWVLVHNGMNDIAASIIATETAVITNFLGNSLWTWKEHKEGHWMVKFAKFQGISLFAAALTVGLFWAFHNLLQMPLLVANTIAILITFTINYFLNSRFTWRRDT